MVSVNRALVVVDPTVLFVILVAYLVWRYYQPLFVGTVTQPPWFPNHTPRYRRVTLPATVEWYKIYGDHTMPFTQWSNKWWLHVRGWNKLAAFRISSEIAAQGYFIAFRLFDGTVKMTRSFDYESFIALKVGREAVEYAFFRASDGADQISKQDAVLVGCPRLR